MAKKPKNDLPSKRRGARSERIANIHERVAHIVTISRVRGEDAQRAHKNGNWDERQEAALVALEEFVAELEKLIL